MPEQSPFPGGQALELSLGQRRPQNFLTQLGTVFSGVSAGLQGPDKLINFSRALAAQREDEQQSGSRLVNAVKTGLEAINAASEFDKPRVAEVMGTLVGNKN